MKGRLYTYSYTNEKAIYKRLYFDYKTDGKNGISFTGNSITNISELQFNKYPKEYINIKEIEVPDTLVINLFNSNDRETTLMFIEIIKQYAN